MLFGLIFTASCFIDVGDTQGTKEVILLTVQ